jgi:hypothetical protein
VVGCSRPAYVVRLHRARKRLEQALERAAARPPVAENTILEKTR